MVSVATRAGHDLLGIDCGEGRCGSCEVELLRDDADEGVIIRACIARVPKGPQVIELKEILDPIWG